MRRLGAGFGLIGALGAAAELKDDGVVDEAVDGGGRGHGILEDALPLSEDAMKTSSAAVSTGQCIEMLFKVREVPVAPILVGDPRIARRRAPCWPQPIRSWLNRSRP